MAPIPQDSELWAPNLFKILTEGFYEIDYFKREKSGDKYTCTNIPLLVALLVYLNMKDIIQLVIAEDAANKHHSKGALLYTHHNRKKNQEGQIEFPAVCPHSWANIFPLHVKYRGFKTGMELPEFIVALFYGEPTETMIRLRKEVGEATKTLKIGRLQSLLAKGEYEAPGKGKNTEESEHKEKPLNPYLENRIVQNVMDAEREERFEMLDALRKDALARALNISIHMDIISAYDNTDDENEAQDEQEQEQEQANHKAGKSKKSKEADLGRLQFLVRRKGKRMAGPVPKCFADVRSLEAQLDNLIREDSSLDFKASPKAIWDHLGSKHSWKATEPTTVPPGTDLQSQEATKLKKAPVAEDQGLSHQAARAVLGFAKKDNDDDDSDDDDQSDLSSKRRPLPWRQAQEAEMERKVAADQKLPALETTHPVARLSSPTSEKTVEGRSAKGSNQKSPEAPVPGTKRILRSTPPSKTPPKGTSAKGSNEDSPKANADGKRKKVQKKTSTPAKKKKVVTTTDINTGQG